MILLDDDAIRDTLDWLSLVEALRRGHRAGIDIVERLLLSEVPQGEGPENHLLIWSAWRFGAYCGAKLASVFPGNLAKTGTPTNASIYVLFDGRDGRPLAIIDGSEFTVRKTAADSALAASYLARQDAEHLLMIGAGAQAPSQIRALAAVLPSIREVTIWNRSPERAKALATALAREGIRQGRERGVAEPSLAVARELSAAVPKASVISMATAATHPVLEGRLLSPGTHVDLVGSFTPQMRETDDATIARASLFADTRRFTLATTGDFAAPIAAGLITQDDIRADLFELSAGRRPGRMNADEITVFKNGGGGHLDLMCAAAAYERALAKQSQATPEAAAKT